MQYTITLQAGVEKRQEFSGTTLVLLDTGAASSIDMTVEVQGYPAEELRGVKRGLKMLTPGFTGAKFLSAVNATIQVIVSPANISVNYMDGAAVDATIIGTPTVLIGGQPVAVSNDRGAPANPVYVSGITYSDAPATSITDNAAVAVGDVAVSLLAANANRKRARFTNIGTDECTIGTTGHTWAKRCIILGPGDTWVEESAANLAWVGITDTANSASVTVQEVLA